MVEGDAGARVELGVGLGVPKDERWQKRTPLGLESLQVG